jgi:hypothetical protein
MKDDIKAELYRQALLAAGNNDVKSLKQLKEQGLDFYEDSYPRAGEALIEAVEKSALDAAAYILDNSENTNYNKALALYVAIDTGKIENVKFLTEKYKTLLNADKTRLMLLRAEPPHDLDITEVIERCISRGDSHPNWPEPLDQEKVIEMVEYFLEIDPEALEARANCLTPLLTALLYKQPKLAKLLIEKYNANISPPNCIDNAWEKAVKNYGKTDLELLELLLKRGTDINKIFSSMSNNTALHETLYSVKGLETAEFLILNGIDVNVICSHKGTALHMLVQMELDEKDNTTGQYKKISNEDLKKYTRLLVQQGADINLKNFINNGLTAREIVAKEQEADRLKAFDEGVDLGLQDIKNLQYALVVLKPSEHDHMPRVCAEIILNYTGGFVQKLLATKIESPAALKRNDSNDNKFLSPKNKNSKKNKKHESIDSTSDSQNWQDKVKSSEQYSISNKLIKSF